MVAQGEDTRSERNVRYVANLVDFLDQLEKALQSGDVSKLAAQASELRHFTESIEIDSRDAFMQLLDQMREFQRRLREAEILASRDALTGIANRREFNRHLAARIETKREFCVLLFDLDSLKSHNDRFGHLCGDEILKQLAARLNSQVRARDFVCRWGGDEFAVILDCGLDPGLARSRQIAEWLNRPYHVTVEGQEMLIAMHVSVGIAEYVAGETPEQLFHRVDESMYRQKGAQSHWLVARFPPQVLTWIGRTREFAHSDQCRSPGHRRGARHRQAAGDWFRRGREPGRIAGAQQGRAGSGAPGDRARRRQCAADSRRRHRLRAGERRGGSHARALRRSAGAGVRGSGAGTHRPVRGAVAQGLGGDHSHQSAGRDARLPGGAAAHDRAPLGQDHRAQRPGAAAPRPNFSAYAASKTAVVRLVETIAEEVRDHNIQINCMGPERPPTRT